MIISVNPIILGLYKIKEVRVEYKIEGNFLTVKTIPRSGETERLKTCGSSLYVRREKRKDNFFLCPLQSTFIKNFITTFNFNYSDLNSLLRNCIARDRYNASIMKTCDYYRDNPEVPTPIDKLGSFADDMRHAQKLALFASMKIPRFGLFLDRGVGKSKVIIDNLTLRFAYKQIKTVLIVCPRLNIFNTWLPEIEKHSKIKNLPVTTITGAKNDKIQLLSSENREIYIHVLTYDAIRCYQDLMGMYDILIFDESKHIGGDSKRGLAAFQLSSRARYVIEATGTVNTLKKMKDVFFQYKVLDLGATFGLKFPDFQDEYFTDVGRHFPVWVLKKGAMKVARSLMFRRAISYKKEECMDLPPRTVKDVVVPPNDFQRVFMDALVNGLSVMRPEVELKKFFEKNKIDYNKEAEAINNAIPISKIAKLQEITSGFYKPYTDTDNVVSFKSTKLDALVETLETIKGEKVIVWCRFTHDINRLSEVLKKKKIKSCQVHGSKDEIKKWQKSKTVDVLIGMESVGQGFTLNEAAYMGYYSYDYSLDHFNQSIDRNYRDGQKRNTTVFLFQIVSSIDQAILKALRANETFSNKLTDYKLRKIASGN